MNTAVRAISIYSLPSARSSGLPSNKPLQRTPNSAFPLSFGSLWASTSGAPAASEALLAAAEARSVRPTRSGWFATVGSPPVSFLSRGVGPALGVRRGCPRCFLAARVPERVLSDASASTTANSQLHAALNGAVERRGGRGSELRAGQPVANAVGGGSLQARGASCVPHTTRREPICFRGSPSTSWG